MSPPRIEPFNKFTDRYAAFKWWQKGEQLKVMTGSAVTSVITGKANKWGRY